MSKLISIIDITGNTNASGGMIASGYPLSDTGKQVYAIRRNSAGIGDLFIRKNNVLKNFQIQNYHLLDTNARNYRLGDSTTGGTNTVMYYQLHIVHEALNNEKLFKLMRYSAFKSGVKF